MTSEDFATGAHWKGFLEYHFEWCPKYRYNMLRQTRFKDFLLDALNAVARRIRVVLVEAGIQVDHVHVVADLRSWQSPAWVIERLKAESAQALFAYEPKFRLRYPRGHFWAQGKFYRTVSDATAQEVRTYVRAQDHRQKSLLDFQALAA
jgi:putative transposase